MPRSRREDQEGIDSKAELIHAQPNLADSEFNGRRPAPGPVMFHATCSTDWPVSDKYALRHVVFDETASCVSSRNLALNISCGVVVHIIIKEF